MDVARPKLGFWLYEPKFNGWRIMVHVPSLTCFNRNGEPLSIAGEFATSLAELRTGLAKNHKRLLYPDMHGRDCLTPEETEWADCEGLERRHKRGQGTLVLLDLPMINLRLEMRGYIMRETFCPAIDHCASSNTVYSVPQYTDGPAAYSECKLFNQSLGCEFYEGVVAKRAASEYPLNTRNPQTETGLWMKHRWRW